MTGIGQAYGKIILMGEHSVVYGYPSIALPFKGAEITAKINSSDGEHWLDSQLYVGPLAKVPSNLTNVSQLISKLVNDHQLDQDLGLHIEVMSSIPAERGMGSSAAVACAIIRAFYDFIEANLDTDTLLAYADFAETICHGNPSGLDARLAALAKPLLYTKGQALKTFYFTTDYWLVVADTGIVGNTKQAVADLQNQQTSPHPTRSQAVNYYLHHLGNLVYQFKDQLILDKAQQSFESMAQLVSQAHHDLQALQVSSAELDYGVSMACQLGGGGAKMTGGGRGGCYYALAKSQEQALSLGQKLVEKGLAIKTWQVPFSS